jgi:hypothetical protein
MKLCSFSAIVSLTVQLGCGGATGRHAEANGGSAGLGPNPGAGNGDGGSLAPDKPSEVDKTCPEIAPGLRAACVGPLSCSYGTDVRFECRARYTCESDQWISAVGSTSCAPLDDCSSLDPQPKDGEPCDVAGQECASVDRHCQCMPCVSAGCQKLAWRCAVPPLSPCPPLMPNEGSACEQEGQSCVYGNCPIPGGLMDCITHRWKRVGGGCPTGER